MRYGNTVTRDDRNVRNTKVRGANVEGDGYVVTNVVRLNLVRIVFVFESLARPNITFSRVKVGLTVGDLEFALDVAVVVGFLVVEHLLAAGCRHGRAGKTGWRRRNEAVSRNESRNVGGGEAVGYGLHCDWFVEERKNDLKASF